MFFHAWDILRQKFLHDEFFMRAHRGTFYVFRLDNKTCLVFLKNMLAFDDRIILGRLKRSAISERDIYRSHRVDKLVLTQIWSSHRRGIDNLVLSGWNRYDFVIYNGLLLNQVVIIWLLVIRLTNIVWFPIPFHILIEGRTCVLYHACTLLIGLHFLRRSLNKWWEWAWKFILSRLSHSSI